MTEEKTDEPAEQAGDDRGISVGRDASGNAFVTGDNNSVKVIIYQSVSERREPEEAASAEIGPNPYMGLLAFHEEDADRFFGREKQITRLWEKLRDLHQDSSQRSATPRLLPILGPSGSGKSSVARAGLIPELARRPLPGWRNARVAVLTPGSHPVEALAHISTPHLSGCCDGGNKSIDSTRSLTNSRKPIRSCRPERLQMSVVGTSIARARRSLPSQFGRVVRCGGLLQLVKRAGRHRQKPVVLSSDCGGQVCRRHDDCARLSDAAGISSADRSGMGIRLPSKFRNSVLLW